MPEVEVSLEDVERKMLEEDVRVQLDGILYDLVSLRYNFGDMIWNMVSKKLPPLMEHKGNITIDIGDKLGPCEARRVAVYFNVFSQQLYEMAQMLARITVDENTYQITVIGTGNVMDF